MSKNGPSKAILNMTEEEIQKRQLFHVELIEEAVKNTSPEGLTFDELGKYLIDSLGAKRIKLEDFELHGYKMEVLMNHVISDPILKHESDIYARHKKAQELMQEYPFKFDCYEFCEVDGYGNHPRLIIEYSTDSMSMRDGHRKLWDKILVKFSVTTEDIDMRTDRFINFVYAQYRLMNPNQFY